MRNINAVHVNYPTHPSSKLICSQRDYTILDVVIIFSNFFSPERYGESHSYIDR